MFSQIFKKLIIPFFNEERIVKLALSPSGREKYSRSSQQRPSVQILCISGVWETFLCWTIFHHHQLHFFAGSHAIFCREDFRIRNQVF